MKNVRNAVYTIIGGESEGGYDLKMGLTHGCLIIPMAFSGNFLQHMYHLLHWQYFGVSRLYVEFIIISCKPITGQNYMSICFLKEKYRNLCNWQNLPHACHFYFTVACQKSYMTESKLSSAGTLAKHYERTNSQL